MADQQHFEQIYLSTYNKVLKYIVMHCSNLEDVNDIVQEAYIQLHDLMSKNRVELREDLSPFIIGIAKNKMKDFYRNKNKFKFFSRSNNDEKLDILDTISDDIDIEEVTIQSETVEEIWNFLKQKRAVIGKVFYLYYYLDMKVKDIAEELCLNESVIKNHLYRTIKEMNEYFKGEY